MGDGTRSYLAPSDNHDLWDRPDAILSGCAASAKVRQRPKESGGGSRKAKSFVRIWLRWRLCCSSRDCCSTGPQAPIALASIALSVELVAFPIGDDEHESGQACEAHFVCEFGKSDAVRVAGVGAAAWRVRVPLADIADVFVSGRRNLLDAIAEARRTADVKVGPLFAVAGRWEKTRDVDAVVDGVHRTKKNAAGFGWKFSPPEAVSFRDDTWVGENRPFAHSFDQRRVNRKGV